MFGGARAGSSAALKPVAGKASLHQWFLSSMRPMDLPLGLSIDFGQKSAGQGVMRGEQSPHIGRPANPIPSRLCALA